MRLQTQLTLLLVFVAVVPVAVSGGTSAVLSRSSLEQLLEARLIGEARHVAERADGFVSSALTDLRLGSTAIRLEGLSPDEQEGALSLIYRQRDAYNVVALISETGDGLGAPVYLEQGTNDPELKGREVMTTADLEAFSRRVPLAAALAAGAAVGPPYVVESKSHPLMALAVAVPLGGGKRGVIAVELSLASLAERVAEAAEDAHGVAFLVDNELHPFAAKKAESAPVVVPTATLPAQLGKALAPSATTSGSLRETWDTTEMVTAYARLDRLPWAVVVAEDAAGAFAPARQILLQSAFWVLVALLCAVVAGTILARGVSGPVDELVKAAQAFQKGDFTHRTPTLPLAELQRVGAAFNQMAAEVQARDEELRKYNAELEKRVEERTRDLKEAQDQLIQSQKMAAVGELGAGVAHEINNPLAGLLGTTQLMMLRAKEGDPTLPQLRDIEREALRIRDIVQNLMAITPQKGSSGETMVEVNRVVEGALSLMTRPIVAQRIQVRKELDPNLPKVRGRAADLQQALLALLSNAKNAMPEGGVLTLTTRAVDGKLVKLSVSDTGKGIPAEIQDRIWEPFFTTKPVPEAKGLGLTLVHRIMQDHGARVTVESEVGKGSTFHVTLAATREKMHLV
ncbi:MAG: ATP-binding protein [Myxococcota bacterium]